VHIGQFTLRQRIPEAVQAVRVMLLLHGWTGSENSMMVFAGKLPPVAWLVAPRGLYPAPEGGFSWRPFSALQDQSLTRSSQTLKSWPGLDDFRPALQALESLLVPENFPGADLRQVDLVGFSQGAALAYAYALLYPQRIRAVAGLAGFLPDGVVSFLGSQKPLTGKKVFITHGAQDEIVPVVQARRAAEILQQAGADVSYCEDDVGHKLSADCFNALAAYWRDIA